LSTNDEEVFDQTFRDIEVALGSNMAACFLAQQNYKDAEKYCRKVKSIRASTVFAPKVRTDSGN